MANKVRGDYELEDLALELISKINHLRGAHLKLPPFDDELKALLDSGDFVELWTKLVDASGVVFQGDAKETVDMFNIMFELLDTIDPDLGIEPREKLALRVVEIVADVEGSHPESRLMVLANLYNAALITDFPLPRFAVLRSLIRFAKQRKIVSSIESFLDNQTQLLASLAKTPLALQRSTLLEVYEALQSYGDATRLEQTYLIKYLATFDSESERAAIDSGVQSLACTAIGASIGNVLAANGRMLLNLAAVKSLAAAGGSKAQLSILLNIFNDGLLADYLKFYDERKAVLEEFSIDHEKALNSMRLLSLCTSCNNGKDGAISYAEAARDMGLDVAAADMPAQVEQWVMLAIKNGLVDVKMSQPTQQIIVYAATQRNFQPQQWKDMKKKVTRWKTQITKLLATVGSAKAAKSSQGFRMR